MKQKPPTIIKLDKDRIAIIAKHFNLSDWKEDEHLTLVNSDIRIKNTGGLSQKTGLILADTRHFILKEIPWYCSNTEFMVSVTKFQMALKYKGAPIPQLYRAEDGRFFCVISDSTQNKENLQEFSTKIYILQQYVKGYFWDASEAQITGAALLLAKYHKLAKKNYTAEEFPKIPSRSIFDSAYELTTFAIDEIKQKNSNITTEELTQLSNFVKFCQDDLQQLKNRALEAGYGKINLPIHGDFNHTNMVFNKDGEVAGLLDFDNCCIDNPSHDLAKIILHICYFRFKKNSTDFDSPPSEYAAKTALFFLEKYFNNSDFSSFECARYFAIVTRAVAIELCLIGLLRLSYKPESCDTLVKVIELAEKETTKIAETFSSYTEPSIKNTSMPQFML